MSRHTQNMTPSQLKNMFKANYYKYIPIEYINHIKIRYDTDIVKRYNRAQISSKFDDIGEQYAKIFNIYDDESISEIKIELRFDKLSDDANRKIASWYDDVIAEIKSED